MNLKIRRKGKVQHGTKFIKKLYFSTMQAPNCLNCEHPLHSGHHFCPSCGQKSAVHRLSMHDVGHDALHYFVHADKGIFSLIWHLLRRPGQVQKEYVAGKRKKFFPPLNFFLLVAGFYVFMVNVLAVHSEAYVITPQEKAYITSRPTPEKRARAQGMFERRAKIMKFIDKYSNVLAMIATPLISAIIFLFYMKGRYNYTEHLVANMYISGITVLFHGAIVVPLEKMFHLPQMNLLLILYFIFEVTYRAISYYYFINRRTTGAAVKATLVSLVGIFAWVATTFTIIALYIAIGR